MAEMIQWWIIRRSGDLESKECPRCGGVAEWRSSQIGFNVLSILPIWRVCSRHQCVECHLYC